MNTQRRLQNMKRRWERRRDTPPTPPAADDTGHDTPAADIPAAKTAVDPYLLATLERSVSNDPANHTLRIHLVDLLLQDARFAEALGHCEALLLDGNDGTDLQQRRSAARRGLGIAEPDPDPDLEAEAEDQDEDNTISTPVAEAAEVDASGADVDMSDVDGDDGHSGPADRERLRAQDVPTPTIEQLNEIVRPELTLDDVAGMHTVKERLQLSFLEPLRNEEIRRSFGHSLKSSLLLWGPPGCGKTFLARALAGELGLGFVHVGIADILEMWIGSSERNLHDLFEQARAMAPAVVFVDELDALGHKRSQMISSAARSVVNQFLLELDGATSDNEGLFVLGATNQPWDVDPALLRPGRFDRRVLVLPPDFEARRSVIEHHLVHVPTDRIDTVDLARRTDGYSGADLAAACKLATEFALHRSVQTGSTSPVCQEDLHRGVADTTPSTASWFRSAENHVRFSEGSEYDELAAYLAQRNRGGRRR